MSARSDLLEAALACAERHWLILPCRPRGKEPLTPHGFKDATTDQATICNWWAEHPTANIGVATGPVSDIVVVDVDGAEGEESLKLLPVLPSTFTVRTARGRHLYFKCTEPLRSAKLGPGLDFKGEGGYVLAAPSIHPNGPRYEVIDSREPASLPEELLHIVISPRAPTEVGNPVPENAQKIREGERNRTLTSLAGTMRTRGMSREAIEAALLAENRQSCEPPLPDPEVIRIAASVAKYKPKAGAPALRPRIATSNGGSLTSSDQPELHSAIRAAVLDKEAPNFDKRRKVAALIETVLRGCGNFFRTTDGRVFFFYKPELKLFDLDQTPFRHLLTCISGLSVTESFFKFALDRLQAETSSKAPLVEVHSFAHYEPVTGLLAVSDGGPGVWVRQKMSEWHRMHNGDEGFFFITEPDAVAWEPDFTNDDGAIDWFLDKFLFATSPLSIEDSKALLFVWMLHQFFPPLRQTRVIPAFLGPQGSGKTTGERLLGRLLLGRSFDVAGIQRDREDAFTASVTNRVILGVDNADSKIPWLSDVLALYATGQRYRLRKLYTTNEEVSYSPRAILMISSRDPRFNRPDVSERLLPLYFERPKDYRAELEIFSDLERRRGAIMGALLKRVAEIGDSLLSTSPKALPFRMADFASFGERVFFRDGESEEWLALLSRLEVVQAEFASEGDGVIAAISELLNRDGDLEAVSVSELFSRCAGIAKERGFAFPRTVQGFGQALTARRRLIELELGCDVGKSRGHARTRFITIMRRREETREENLMSERKPQGVP